MGEKSYQDIKREFTYFYHNKVLKVLPAYERNRKIAAKKQFLFWMVFGGVFFIWFVLQLGRVFNGAGYSIFLGIVIVIWISCLISLLYLTRNDKKDSRGAVRIENDFEGKLKRKLMWELVGIFLEDAKWYRGALLTIEDSVGVDKDGFPVYSNETIRHQEDMKNRTKFLRAQNIMNPFPWIFYDDIMFGKFKNVRVSIMEGNACIINTVSVVFLIIGLGFCSFILNILLIPIIIILLIVFSKKIYQYAPFRGVIVVLEMNKRFSGHTFFFEKSVTANKIPIDKKKVSAVMLEKSDFSDKYQVFSDNQIEARYLLTTAMMERIEGLSFAFKAKSVRGSFMNNKLTLAINTGRDMFSMGGDFKESDSNVFMQLYDEIISVLQIVDELKLDEHTGL